MNLTIYSEESLPLDYQQAVLDAVVAFTETLGVGADVLPSRYYPPILLNNSGFSIDDITVDTIPTSTPTTSQLAISNVQFATVDESDITVSIT